MSFLPCTDPIPACPVCPNGQSCIQTGRSDTQCAQNICIANASGQPAPNAPIGGTIGGALGGVLGIVAALGLVYYFWWKPRGLAASRQRYSRHLSARQSRLPSGLDKKIAEGTQQKRTSVHLRMDGLDSGLSRRGGGSDAEESIPRSNVATGGHSRSESVDANPFGDHNRSSLNPGVRSSTRTSDFSFRSSTSTNIIPIAYIPPHSNSISLEDSVRGAYGEVISSETTPDRRHFENPRNSIPVSMASRDSTDLMSGPLSPLDSPTVPPVASTSGGAPMRPLRSPGLDLQLPTPSPPTSPHRGFRPVSGFPWDPPTPSQLGVPSREPRGLSRDLNRKESHLSTYSTMSTSTTRSGNSTLSYILDPPQIITPVNAQGLRRVEVLGRGQAGLVRIGGSAAGTTPTTPAPMTGGSYTDSTGSTTPPALKAFGAQQLAVNPFSDDASVSPASERFSVGNIASPAITVDSHDSSQYYPDSSRRDTVSTLNAEDGKTDSQSRMSYASSRSEPPELDGNFATVQPGGPRSPPLRSPLFPMPPQRSPDRKEVALPSPSTSSHSPVTSDSSYKYQPDSSSKPMRMDTPPPTSSNGPPSPGDSPLPTPFLPFAGQRPESTASSSRNSHAYDTTNPNTPRYDRVQSQAISVRSGFGSGLSQIPFQLGFPSGLDGGSERGSMISLDSRRSSNGTSFADAEDGEMGVRETDDEEEEEEEEAVISRPNRIVLKHQVSPSMTSFSSAMTSAPSPSGVVENPFGQHAEVAQEGQSETLEGEADSRASLDTLELSKELAKSLGQGQ